MLQNVVANAIELGIGGDRFWGEWARDGDGRAVRERGAAEERPAEDGGAHDEGIRDDDEMKYADVGHPRVRGEVCLFRGILDEGQFPRDFVYNCPDLERSIKK
jgi:hypothetical protein